MIIAISTNKGGVLKTSITTNLAGIMSAEGRRVLIVDTDNQGNCALSFGRNPDAAAPTTYDVLIGKATAEKAIINVYRNIDMIPANDDMAFFDFDVLREPKYPAPFGMLRRAMEPIRTAYDVILIDTPPNLGLVTGNVLAAADRVLIPFQPESYSMRSLIKIIQAIDDFRQQHNPGLAVLGVVATLVDARTTLHSQVIQEARRFCAENGIRMFDTVIPRSVRFAAAVAYDRLPATLADAKNPIVAAYRQLYREVFAGG